MKNYEERIAKRKKTYEDFLRREGILETFLKDLSPILSREDLSGAVNSYTTDISYTADSAEDAELEVIPGLSELFGIKWQKFLDDTKIFYYTSIAFQGETIYFSLCLSPSNACKIIPVPTGKMTTVSRFVEIETEEIEYIVDCGEES